MSGIDKEKLERQRLGFKKWVDANYRGTWQWVTAVGKGFASRLAAKHFIKKDPEFSVIVCVPTDELRSQWREDVENLGYPDNFYIDTVHNLAKDNIECDMLILDEIHMYVGEEAEVFPLVFKSVKADKILGLTATLGHDGIRREIVDKMCPVVDIIDLREATENGYVADHILYNLPVHMSPEEEMEYKKIDKRFQSCFNHFARSFDTMKRVVQDNDYAELLARRKGWSDAGALIGMASKGLRATQDRARFLYSAPCKIEAAKAVIDRFPDKRFITFGETTDAADILARRLGGEALSYHSNIPTQLVNDENEKIGEKVGKGAYMLKGVEGSYSWSEIKGIYDGNITRLGSKRVRDYVIEQFENGYIRGLCSAKALDVGFDNADIELAVLLSGSSNPRQLIQRVGRAIRKKEGKRAIIVQLYIPNSQEEQWLRNRHTKTGNVKDIVSISQITT